MSSGTILKTVQKSQIYIFVKEIVFMGLEQIRRIAHDIAGG